MRVRKLANFLRVTMKYRNRVVEKAPFPHGLIEILDRSKSRRFPIRFVRVGCTHRVYVPMPRCRSAIAYLRREKWEPCRTAKAERRRRDETISSICKDSPISGTTARSIPREPKFASSLAFLARFEFTSYLDAVRKRLQAITVVFEST